MVAYFVSRSGRKSHTSWNPNPTRASCDVSNDNFQLPALSRLCNWIGNGQRERADQDWELEREWEMRCLIDNCDNADKKSTPWGWRGLWPKNASWLEPNCPDQAQKTNKYHTFVYVQMKKSQNKAGETKANNNNNGNSSGQFGLFCSVLVLCCSCACVPAICSYLCHSLPPSLSLCISGEIRVKVTAAFLAGKCENSQNENQMQTPQPAKGNRQPATAQKKSHLAQEVDAWGLCPCLPLAHSLFAIVRRVHPQNSP